MYASSPGLRGARRISPCNWWSDGRILGAIAPCFFEGFFAMNTPMLSTAENEAASTDWDLFAERVLAGDAISAGDALAVLDCPDDELLDLLAAGYRSHTLCSQFLRLYFPSLGEKMNVALDSVIAAT